MKSDFVVYLLPNHNVFQVDNADKKPNRSDKPKYFLLLLISTDCEVLTTHSALGGITFSLTSLMLRWGIVSKVYNILPVPSLLPD